MVLIVDNWLYQTTNIIDVVQKTMYNTQTDWYKGAAEMLPDHVARHEFKTLNFTLLRRSGTSTAALMLYELYPDSVIFYPNHKEREYHTREKYGKNPRRIFVMPDRLGMLDEEQWLVPCRAMPSISLVMFDGTRRMREVVYPRVMEILNPMAKLFVLLG
jgi:hypothetical protein